MAVHHETLRQEGKLTAGLAAFLRVQLICDYLLDGSK